MALYSSTDNFQYPQRQASSDLKQSMASQLAQSSPTTNSYLSRNQQDLLLAALNSQATGRQGSQTQTTDNTRSASDPSIQQTMNGANGDGLFMSPHEADLDFNDAYSPNVDYLDGDGFDFDNADLGGEMIGALPGGLDDGLEHHDKRKMSEDGSDDEEGDPKRQEGEKGAKKPGRKPLTSEPTTKRKAQNRAAQRAFRERKEKHLKDLETKVTALEKKSEADKHENGLLKAQMERMQVELREYRKRLSLNSNSGGNRSPPGTGYGGQQRSNSNPAAHANNFQFEFPKFGGLPGSQIFGNAMNGTNSQRQSTTPPLNSPHGSFSGNSPANDYSRKNSVNRSMSPQSLGAMNTGSPSQITNPSQTFTNFSTNDNLHGFADSLPQMNNSANDPFGDLFSPSILKSASIDSNGNYFGTNGVANGVQNGDNLGGDSTAGLNRVFQFNSNSTSSDSASPSGSSNSQWNGNANSSCGTSPEPSHDSPANKSKGVENLTNTTKTQSPLSMNHTPNNLSHQLGDAAYNIPSLDSFDPVLFGDYRESNDAIVGGGDFTGGFFDEALNPAPFDYASPSNLFGILQSPQPMNSSLETPATGAANAPTPSKNLMAEIEKARDGGDDDYGLPKQTEVKKYDSNGKMISCNSIWSQLQSNPDFQEGKFDLDGLCSELRAKARCSESGVMVDQNHVDQALRKLGKKDEKTGAPNQGSQNLMFEQDSWDNVLKKLGNKTV